MDAAGAGSPEHPPKRRTPGCALGLATGALVCHVLALVGNIQVAERIEALGHSTDRWSDVGVGLAGGLSTELDWQMRQVAEGLTQAVPLLASVEEHMHGVLLVLDTLQNETARGALSGELLQKLTQAAAPVVAALSSSLSSFYGLIKPELLQVQRWLVTFGDKLVRSLESFSVGLDVAQKLLDQVMSQLQSSGANEEQMLYDTYNLFDVSKGGGISIEDLRNVSVMYAVTALQGDKAVELFKKYDADHDGSLDTAEYALLVKDGALPSVMAVVLRSYARRLGVVAGHIRSARMRGEVAAAASEYLAVVCAKNRTRLTWIVTALTNRSVPVDFAAQVLAALATDSNDPNKMSAAAVGTMVVDEMVTQAPAYVTDVMALVLNASFWEAEGLDVQAQPAAAEKVTRWVAAASDHRKAAAALLAALPRRAPPAAAARSGRRPVGQAAGAAQHAAARAAEVEPLEEEASLLQCSRGAARRPAATGAAATQEDGAEQEVEEEPVLLLQRAATRHAARLAAASAAQADANAGAERAAATLRAALPRAARRAVERSRRVMERARLEACARRARPSAGNAAQPDVLLQHLAHLASAAPILDVDAQKVVNSATAAAPEVLLWASWLAANASSTSMRHLRHSFEYTGQSAGATDSAAQVFSKMTSRFASFLQMLHQYASPLAIRNLEGFINRTSLLLDGNVSAALADPSGLNVTALVGTLQLDWARVGPALSTLKTTLPSCIEEIHRARQGVTAASALLHSGFAVMKERGPPVFDSFFKLYQTVWVVYFVVFALLTFALLFYAFFETGYFDAGRGRHHPQPGEELEVYGAPCGCGAQLRACLQSCLCCLGYCDDHQITFWSVIFLVELLWVLMFAASYVVLVASGVRSFLSASCAPLYILGNGAIAAEALELVSTFLGRSDWIVGAHLDPKSLLVCDILGRKLGTGMLLASAGNAVAGALSFYLVVDAAILHEGRRQRKVMREVA